MQKIETEIAAGKDDLQLERQRLQGFAELTQRITQGAEITDIPESERQTLVSYLEELSIKHIQQAIDLQAGSINADEPSIEVLSLVQQVTDIDAFIAGLKLPVEENYPLKS